MAYDSAGSWTPEDDRVETRFNDIIKPDSPLIIGAQTGAAEAANKRGMLNSSLAIGAGTKAAYDVALPIASQDASQTSAKNLSKQGYGQSTGLQAQSIQGQKDIQAQQIAGNKDLQSTQIAADKETQGNALANNLSIANLDARVREELGSLDASTQTSIANMNVAADQRNKATALAVAIGGNYAQSFSAIANDASIPAATRDLYLQNIAAQRSSDLSLIEQLFGFDLTWTNPNTGASGSSSVPGAQSGGAQSSIASATPATGRLKFLKDQGLI